MSMNDSFSFNADFSAPLFKIKIGTIASKVENADERKETKNRVDEERRYQMEVIVFWTDLFVILLTAGAGMHCENYERPQAYATQRSCERSHTSANKPLSAQSFGYQEAHRRIDRGAYL